jgi:hypothetical protein
MPVVTAARCLTEHAVQRRGLITNPKLTRIFSRRTLLMLHNWRKLVSSSRTGRGMTVG